MSSIATAVPAGGHIPAPVPLRAYCGPDGVVQFAAATPSGFTEIVSGPPHQVRRYLAIVCRHAHTRGVLLVPDMPEADDRPAAKAALEKFIEWAGGRCGNATLSWNHSLKVAL